MFSTLLYIFNTKTPSKELAALYSDLNRIASVLCKNLKELRELQKKLVDRKLKYATESGRATGKIGLEKTLFIEEMLVNALNNLAEHCERRFFSVEEEIRENEPIPPVERDELNKILDFLRKLHSSLPALTHLDKLRDEKEKLRRVEDCLRNITILSKEFYEAEKYREDLIRRVAENEISPLLRRIYEHPQKRGGLLVYELSETQLRAIEKEAPKINACGDPAYEILWRHWWRDVQIPSLDRTTPLKEPHVNVTLRLFGKEKKEIHLLVTK